MSTREPAAPVRLDWTAAEAAAAAHRRRRQHPDERERAANRTLRPTAIALWIVTVVVAGVGLLTPGETGIAIGIVGYGLIFAYGAVALVWGSRTGHWLLRGSAASIRSALPVGSWPAVRRQLALDESVDREHRSVIVELAHQQRRLLGGILAYGGFAVPLYLSIAHSNNGWFRYGMLLLCVVLVIWGTIAGVSAYRRLGRVIEATSD